VAPLDVSSLIDGRAGKLGLAAGWHAIRRCLVSRGAPPSAARPAPKPSATC